MTVHTIPEWRSLLAKFLGLSRRDGCERVYESPNGPTWIHSDADNEHVYASINDRWFVSVHQIDARQVAYVVPFEDEALTPKEQRTLDALDRFCGGALLPIVTDEVIAA